MHNGNTDRAVFTEIRLGFFYTIQTAGRFKHQRFHGFAVVRQRIDRAHRRFHHAARCAENGTGTGIIGKEVFIALHGLAVFQMHAAAAKKLGEFSHCEYRIHVFALFPRERRPQCFTLFGCTRHDGNDTQFFSRHIEFGRQKRLS